MSAHRSIYNMVLLYVQTSCCRWDSLRRRSRTRWWTRSTTTWWPHTCFWTIGTLRLLRFFLNHASPCNTRVIITMQGTVCQSWAVLYEEVTLSLYIFFLIICIWFFFFFLVLSVYVTYTSFFLSCIKTSVLVFPSAWWRWHQTSAGKWCKQHKCSPPAS